MPNRNTTTCDAGDCEGPAIIRLTITTIEGIVLDKTELCLTCARSALMNTGLEPGDLNSLDAEARRNAR